LTRFIQKQPEDYKLPENLGNISLDETVECTIQDAQSSEERSKHVKNSIRKVFAFRKIYVEFTMRNPLLIPINCTNLRLVCAYDSDKVQVNPNLSQATRSHDDFDCPPVNIELKPMQSQTILLTCMPKKPGQIKIKRIEWDFMQTFSIYFPLINETGLYVEKQIENDIAKLT
jgi:hypothetical protein